jgi:hypothetical protein
LPTVVASPILANLRQVVNVVPGIFAR